MASSRIRARPIERDQGPAHLSRSWVQWSVAGLVLGFATYFVFRGALGLFFAQEDFRGIAAAKGLLPRHASLWRYVSVQTFMDVFYPLFGDSPKPYHAVGLILHVINATLLFGLLARRLAPAPSIIGAGLFATHPALFTAVYWLSARSDILATTFALSTLWLSTRRGRERWLAVPCFALGLLSKESIILLPVAIWLIHRWARTAEAAEGRQRELVIPVLCLMSFAYASYLLTGGAGVGVGNGLESAYALSFSGAVVRNLLTYVGWTVDVAMRPSPMRFLDLQNPDVFVFGIMGLVAWGLGCLVSRLRQRGWLVGGAAFLLLLLPVLPLRNHTYHYFLYAPLAAIAWCVSAPLDWAFEAVSKRRTFALTWAAAALCLIVLTWNGARLAHRMETRPMRVYPALRGDPIVSRAIVAENVIKGLRDTPLPASTDLVFVLRERIASFARIAHGSQEPGWPDEDIYPETNVRNALYDGLGVRALVPSVASVAFARDSIRLRANTRIVIYAPEGDVTVCTPEQLDTLLRTTWITKW